MKYKYLEYLRACAALAVFVNHIVGKLPYLEKHKGAALQSIGAWGTEAVIIFFLLSGVVINHTVKKSEQNTTTFLKKRAIRILPIYYTCIILAVGIDSVTNFQTNTAANYLGTFFFVATLHGLLTQPMATIGVAWSLSFEVFFYIIYSFTIGKNQKKLLLAWIFLSLISVFLYYISISNNVLAYFVLMLSFSSLWLVGYFIYEFKHLFKTNFSTAVFAFSMIPLINRLQISPYYYDVIIYLVTAFVCIPIFIFALKSSEQEISNQKLFKITHLHYLPVYFLAAFLSLMYSKSLLISRIIYLSIPLISLILLNGKVEYIIKSMLKSWESVMLFIASISYALYLTHMPIIFLFGRLMPSVVIPNIIFIIIVVFALSTFLEHFLQKKINLFFKRS